MLGWLKDLTTVLSFNWCLADYFNLFIYLDDSGELREDINKEGYEENKINK